MKLFVIREHNHDGSADIILKVNDDSLKSNQMLLAEYRDYDDIMEHLSDEFAYVTYICNKRQVRVYDLRWWIDKSIITVEDRLVDAKEYLEELLKTEFNKYIVAVGHFEGNDTNVLRYSKISFEEYKKYKGEQYKFWIDKGYDDAKILITWFEDCVSYLMQHGGIEY